MQNKRIIIKKFIFLTVVVLFFFFSFSGSVLAALAKKCDPADPMSCPAGQKCVEQEIAGKTKTENRCARALEIVYPIIPGQPGAEPTTVATGIPEYVRYIFQLSIFIVGFIIFGVFVYSGTKYLASAGNPSVLLDARTGMSAALLGAVILFASYLIFVTINPQLTVLSLPSISILEQVVSAGVYVCNYEYVGNSVVNQAVSDGIIADNSIGTILSGYISKEGEEQIEVAKLFQTVIVNPDNRSQTCQKANYSGNFQNFVVKEKDTMFVVPSIGFSLNAAGTGYEKKPLYQYGLILHEKDDYGGKCAIYPDLGPIGTVYTETEIDNEGRIIIHDEPYIGEPYSNPVLEFKAGDLIKDFKGGKARSITVFKKPATQPFGGAKGLTMYMCLDSDRIGCPEYLETAGAVDKNTGEPLYPASGGEPPYTGVPTLTMDYFTVTDLKDVAPLGGNGIRSVKIEPKDLVFAVLYDYEANCAIIKQNNPDIGNINLKRCDAGDTLDPTTGQPKNGACNKKHNAFFLHWGGETDKCVSCIGKMKIFNGKAL